MFFWQGLLFFFLFDAFVLLWVIGKLGFFKTLFLMFFSAACGSLLIQRQGWSMLSTVQNSLNRRAVPVDNLFDGICIFIAGLLLIIPGFLGDVIAVALLIPAFRHFLKSKSALWNGTQTTRSNPYGEDVIDGSYVRVEKSVELIEQDSINPDDRAKS